MPKPARDATSCPFCETPLSRGATECHGCLLPLTMAATGTSRSPGTSSTASLSSSAPLRFDPHVLPPRRRAHRLRLTAWLLGLTALLLLLAGVGSLLTIRDPDVRSDVEARTNLTLGLRRAKGAPPEPAVPAAVVDGADASQGADVMSVREADGEWYGAAQSSSGRCFVLASTTAPTGKVYGGTLDASEPCTGDEARVRLADRVRSPG